MPSDYQKCHFHTKGKNVTSHANSLPAHGQLTHSQNDMCELLQLGLCWLDAYFSFSLCGWIMSKFCTFIFQAKFQTTSLCHEMMIPTNFKYHSWGVAKIPTQKFQLFHKLDNFAPGPFNCPVEIWLFALTTFGKIQLCTMKVHVKWSLCI